MGKFLRIAIKTIEVRKLKREKILPMTSTCRCCCFSFLTLAKDVNLKIFGFEYKISPILRDLEISPKPVLET